MLARIVLHCNDSQLIDSFLGQTVRVLLQTLPSHLLVPGAVAQAVDRGRGHGISLLGGWLPLTVEIATVVVVIAAVGWRSRRWRFVWVPVSLGVAALGALLARWYMNSQGLASDPAPAQLWVWTGVLVFAVAVLFLGWRRSRWWRRSLSVVMIPLAVAAAALSLNQWVGYYPTAQTAWDALTDRPVPDQTDAADLTALRNTTPTTGKVVPIVTPDTASGFKHRTEYVYLPPAWFAGDTPPALPTILMVGGEFNTPADWIRSGDAIATADAFAQSHDGDAPILVFADSGGTFNNDTECVDGPRGNSASHLVDDVRPYVVSTFGASDAAADWGVAGWSMGGTCAVDLTVMHPDLFSNFLDIAGDLGPTAGTPDQTLDRLYGGDAAAMAQFDPTTVMTTHGPYTGVSGWFDESDPNAAQHRGKGQNGGGQGGGDRQNWSPPAAGGSASGLGGRDDTRDTESTGSAETLCATATSVNIACTVHTMPDGHTWQFAQQAFTDALPWMAEQIHTPGVAPST